MTKERGMPVPVVESVFRKLGGLPVLGQEVTSDADLARLVNHRIPVRALTLVKRIGFSDREIGQFIIPPRTQRHRKAKRERLSVEESDRLVRLTRIQSLAEDVFGEAEKGNRWLRQRLGILDGKTPLEVAQTDSGARVVEQLLAKIDWGAAA
jgi:putative toxin-antitoxin system antitoxin component (TIGR02293 family)